MPVSPSMERELGEAAGSMDSIVSTGSNQELRSQLDSTLAEVEALTEHLEKQKLSPAAESGKMEVCPLSSSPTSSTPMPSARRKTSSGEGRQSKQPQPQPRSLPRPNKEPESKEKASPDSKDNGKVLLRQSSWASREQLALNIESKDPPSNSTLSLSIGSPNSGGIFAKNRSMWERRASSQSQSGASDDANLTGTEDNETAVKAGFRSNRDFWEQRVTMRQKQTPDLVLDLPVNTLSTSPSHVAPNTSLPAALGAPVPKPRPRPSMEGSRSPESDSLNPRVLTGSNRISSGDENIADQFAKTDRNTLKKLKPETKHGEGDVVQSSAVENPRVTTTVNKTSP